MEGIKTVCVYCGSGFGDRKRYREAASVLGTLLAQRNIDLIYGGASIGLMGTVADAAMAAGGKAIGVIPQSLADAEVAHEGLSELHIVSSMHERKHMMAERADAFISMPGGFGTLEELFEVVTWSQLGLHQKACGLLNVDGFYDGLLSFLDHATAEKFIREQNREIILVEETPHALLGKLIAFAASTEKSD